MIQAEPLVTPDGNALTSEGKIALESILCPQGPSILSTIEQFYGSVPEHIKNELYGACAWSPEFNSGSEAITPSDQLAPQQYTQGGVDWMNICQTVKVALYNSCISLVNNDNSLTFEGERALGCKGMKLDEEPRLIMSPRKIYITHCSAKKNPILMDNKARVTPDKLYMVAPTQRFMSEGKNKGVNWAILSDKYGIW